MVVRGIKTMVWISGGLAFAYLAFFVTLGERTLAEHVRRIVQTEEAQELSRDLYSAADSAAATLKKTLATP